MFDCKTIQISKVNNSVFEGGTLQNILAFFFISINGTKFSGMDFTSVTRRGVFTEPQETKKIKGEIISRIGKRENCLFFIAISTFLIRE